MPFQNRNRLWQDTTEDGAVPKTPHPVEIRVGSQNRKRYPVWVGKGVWEKIRSHIPQRIFRVALVADRRVADLYADQIEDLIGAVNLRVDRFVFESGEQQKTRKTKAWIEDQMISAGMGRDTLLCALGGGVTTDLAGFVAATYMRGISYIGLPTTLLGMVDASIGGKTGINTPQGKNLIGAFHPPTAVFSQVDSLQSLDAAEVENGMVEMFKHALIADAGYAGFLVQNAPSIREGETAVLIRAIAESVRIKADVVGQDPAECGKRRVLNFGHTVAHALEKIHHWKISHGHAVALGMWFETCVAARLGVCDRQTKDDIQHALRMMRFDTQLKEIDSNTLVEAMRGDKKNEQAEILMSLPQKIGKMFENDGKWAVTIDPRIIEEVLRESIVDPLPNLV
jgi:3-dehydroquinate synthase